MKKSLLPGYPKGEFITELIESVLASVDPELSVQKQCQRAGDQLIVAQHSYELKTYGAIHVIGFGKAVLSMALGLVSVLGDSVGDGFLITKHLDQTKQAQLPDSFTIMKGNHPVPGADTFASSAALLKFAANIQPEDLVIVLVSGGGSALCSAPVEAISSDDLQNITQILLGCGAEIQEMNAIRKHLDQIKGGGLAELLEPATVISLILSDVIGSPLDVIASGPTVPDSSTFNDVAEIFSRYDLWQRLPDSIGQLVENALAGQIPDTPKLGSDCFQHVSNYLIADNRLACQTAVEFARKAGLNAELMTTALNGEAREVGKVLASLMKHIRKYHSPFKPPVCLVFGGETTVTLKGTGKGGRNQELALGALPEIAGLDDVLLVTLATDGEDGPTDAAGAWVTGESLRKVKALDLSVDEAINNSDSYAFFSTLNQIVHTGPTGTNVNDVTVCFVF